MQQQLLILVIIWMIISTTIITYYIESLHAYDFSIKNTQENLSFIVIYRIDRIINRFPRILK